MVSKIRPSFGLVLTKMELGNSYPTNLLTQERFIIHTIIGRILMFDPIINQNQSPQQDSIMGLTKLRSLVTLYAVTVPMVKEIKEELTNIGFRLLTSLCPPQLHYLNVMVVKVISV
jgi:exosome complex RNA-binding protein Rrp42 (RNase PH superfamily)